MTVVLASVAFWAPVVYRRVGDDLKAETLSFRARYRRLKKSERQALDRRIQARSMAPEALQARLQDMRLTDKERQALELQMQAKPISDEEFLDTLLVDWDLCDRDGAFIPYSKTARTELEEDLDGLESVLVESYFSAIRKALSPQELEKNSEAQSATT